jgi:hypothetical protein
MASEPLPLPAELCQALDASGGLPIRFEHPETHELFILQPAPVEMTLDEDYINRELEKGLADIDAGRVAPWDVEAFLAEAHRRYAAENR